MARGPHLTRRRRDRDDELLQAIDCDEYSVHATITICQTPVCLCKSMKIEFPRADWPPSLCYYVGILIRASIQSRYAETH